MVDFAIIAAHWQINCQMLESLFFAKRLVVVIFAVVNVKKCSAILKEKKICYIQITCSSYIF